MAVHAVATRMQAQLSRPIFLALIFFPFSALAVLIGVFLIPPFQTPDEAAHFLRAVQVSEGTVFGEKEGGQSGGRLPDHLRSVIFVTDDLIGHPERRASLSRIDDASSVTWGNTSVFMGFPNTVTYGPLAYAPQAAGVVTGRLFRMPVLQTFYLSRLFNGAAFVALATAAIALCQRGRLFLLIVLFLPMTIHLAASVSQDGSLIGLSAVLAALLTRHERRHPWPWTAWAAVGLGFGVIGMAKPPDVALALIPCLLVGRQELRNAMLCLVVASVLTVAWLIWGVAPVKVQLQSGAGFSDFLQAHYVLSHPVGMLRLILHTLYENWQFYTAEFIGVLGWLDTPFQSWFYRVAKQVLVVTFLLGFFVPPGGATSRDVVWETLRRIGVASVVALSCVGIFVSLFIIWTKVGAPIIDGLQGRYFLPGACFLVLILPRWRPMRRAAYNIIAHDMSLIGAVVWMTTVLGVYARLLAVRFW
ncbi:DUF2142 domain-containing protein [Acetobacter sacchari]|uniref:DUF2142 domain-containing protein n=1 Tax=Acetobacter sacchari TaxID=2661687 RepID=A0ABS3LTZ1_9PROT|nr:DUF2142 domain-containing protein [Acetobacter sacchari]MBO1359380.1 DUF2142 domain-containing protein [Acetobacter sacchari]